MMSPCSGAFLSHKGGSARGASATVVTGVWLSPDNSEHSHGLLFGCIGGYVIWPSWRCEGVKGLHKYNPVVVVLKEAVTHIFSTRTRKIGKAWSIWWCNDDVSATISNSTTRSSAEKVADTSSLHHQIDQAFPIFLAWVENMGKPGYEARQRSS